MPHAARPRLVTRTPPGLIATSTTTAAYDPRFELLDGRLITSNDVEAAATLVARGGNLILGGHAWYHFNSATIANNVGNQMLRAAGLGIFISTATASPGTHTVGAEPPSRFTHAWYALDALASSPADLDVMARDAASAAATTAAQALPLQLYTQYWARLQAFVNDLTISPTMDTPFNAAADPVGKLQLTIEALVLELLPASEAHRSAIDFPGTVPSSASSVSQTLTIDGTYAGRDSDYMYSNAGAAVWRSTGLYANAGEQVNVSLPSSATSAGLQLRIGCHSDSLMALDLMKRFPKVTKTTDLDQEFVSTASAFGGLLYLTVPAGVALGSISVTISGAFMAPLYIHGIDSLADWQGRLATSAAPWGELVSSKLIITVPSSLLNSSAAADPITLMNAWDLLMDAAADLEGTLHARAREERFVADRQISAGWMHSGYPIMGYGSGAESFLLVDVNDGDGWGPFHELGHNHQYRGWFLPGTTETTCNLWSVKMYDSLNISAADGHSALSASSRATRLADYRANANKVMGNDGPWNVWVALETYLQLQEAFGWSFYTTIFTQYRGISNPGTDSARIDEWVRRSSTVASKNLGPFYQAWGFPVTQSVLDEIENLPAWAEDPMV